MLSAVLLIASFAVLFVLAAAVHRAGPIWFDLPVEGDVQRVHWGGVGTMFTLTDWLGEPSHAAVLVGAVAVILAVLRKFRASLLSVLALGANGAEVLMKHVVERPRPTSGLVNVLAHESSFSFPSGHATFFAAWLGVLLVLFTRRTRTGPRMVLAVVALAVTGIAGLARLDVGAHWPTDVIGGYLLGAAWALLLWPLLRRA